MYVPHAIITDKLGSYAAAKAEVLPTVEHRTARWLHNRAENSHEPTRERERRMRGFKSPGHAQRFLSVFGVIASFFRPGRHLLAAVNYREVMRRRFTQWHALVCLQPAIESETPHIGNSLARASAFSTHIDVKLTKPQPSVPRPANVRCGSNVGHWREGSSPAHGCVGKPGRNLTIVVGKTLQS